jgi:hypothetical protein
LSRDTDVVFRPGETDLPKHTTSPIEGLGRTLLVLDNGYLGTPGTWTEAAGLLERPRRDIRQIK